MTLQKYDNRTKSRSVPAKVTIYNTGSISVNTPAHKKMGQPKYAELWFDSEERCIGILPLLERTPASYVLSKTTSGSEYRISAKTFLRDCDIDYDVSQRYDATLRGGYLIVDLNHGIPSRGYRTSLKNAEDPHDGSKLTPAPVAAKQAQTA
ncbi:MAG: hypothetical protein M3Z36_03450 [Acidobacteriota bacterium]|nr:hypothetical protein [Acidobacteriota bacterium]